MSEDLNRSGEIAFINQPRRTGSALQLRAAMHMVNEKSSIVGRDDRVELFARTFPLARWDSLEERLGLLRVSVPSVKRLLEEDTKRGHARRIYPSNCRPFP